MINLALLKDSSTNFIGIPFDLCLIEHKTKAKQLQISLNNNKFL